MDIDGGMKIDVFDSMAEGVTGAAIILCFMSDKYENSQNCKLELKFARQTGVPIIPIMMEDPSKWQAGGWLGILTAGSLWTPLYSDVGFEENIDAVIGQVFWVIDDP
jgi:hypothetical protein